MNDKFAWLIWLAGWGQLCVLFASALVPWQLDWRRVMAPLPPLLRQLFWIYGGYVVLSIVALGAIAITQAPALAEQSPLARSFCAYAALFWGIRLALQPFLAAGPYLHRGWLRAGYHLLSLWFALLLAAFSWAALA